MADYGGTSEMKVVNATQLDADLTSVANAIRTRGGTTEPMSFPNGMAEAVESIPDFLAKRVTKVLTEYTSEAIGHQVYNFGFAGCESLTSLSLPNVKMLQYYALYGCIELTNVNVPQAWYIGNSSFSGCKKLSFLDLPSARNIYKTAFSSCVVLETLILRYSDGVASLENANAFTNTPIASGTGYIYVPSALVDSYKAATNWSTYADQIRAIEDYPEITGGA